MKSKIGLLIIVIALCFSNNLSAQPQDSLQKQLYKTVAALDSSLFEAFNKRDTSSFKSYFAKDLEFFHDIGGLTGYAHTINFLKEISKPGNDLKRTLIKESLEVYPIPGYGAIEIGSHVFCHTENKEQSCGTFKFLQVWQQLNGEWKITRVISYGHKKS